MATPPTPNYSAFCQDPGTYLYTAEQSATQGHAIEWQCCTSATDCSEPALMVFLPEPSGVAMLLVGLLLLAVLGCAQGHPCWFEREGDDYRMDHACHGAHAEESE